MNRDRTKETECLQVETVWLRFQIGLATASLPRQRQIHLYYLRMGMFLFEAPEIKRPWNESDE